jgi:hypothetical protein
MVESINFHLSVAVVLGLVCGIWAPVGSWRSIIAFELVGFLLIAAGALFGVHGDLTSPLLRKLLLFDRTLVLEFGTIFRLIGLGYFLTICGVCMSLRKVLNHARKHSNPTHQNGPAESGRPLS